MGSVSTRIVRQIHTRKLDRSVAHHNMKRAGIKRVNKEDCTYVKNPFGGITKSSNGSYFSNHWREYIKVPTIDLRRRFSK